MAKKTSRAKAKKELEGLVKEFVKRRDEYTCQKCGLKVSGTNCHASHVFPVGSHGKLEFDPQNLKVLCGYHHLFWWHKHPTEAGEWFREKFPDRYNYLVEKDRLPTVPIKEWQYREKIEEFKKLLT